MDNTTIAILGCSIIFLATTLGACFVFFVKSDFNKKVNSVICGFSAGVMVAASFFGLILPAIENAENMGKLSFLPITIGVFIGCIFLTLIDLITKLINKRAKKTELAPASKTKLTRFFIAFTIHNIPEGMAVGVALGNALSLGSRAAMISALMLAIGIAVQNIPEGMAVALPVYKETKSRLKGFFLGMLSGVVEPIFAVIGLVLAKRIQVLLSWSLSFAAGAMLFVTFEDLIPEAKLSETSHLGTWSTIIGFILMMLLDLTL